MRNLLRILILLFVRLIGAAYTLNPNQPVRQAQVPRILLVRPDHLGDLIMTTPVLNALKERIPYAQITMMVGPWSSEIVARHSAVDHLKTCSFPGFRRSSQNPFEPYVLMFKVAKELRQEHYDLAINLRPDFWWGAALLYLARIPRRIGYAIEPGTPFLSRTLPFLTPEHATISCLKLASAGLEDLGYAPLEEPFTPARYPQVFIPTTDEQRWVAERLKDAGIRPTTPLLVIQPGSGAAVKLWRSDAWGNTLDRLLPLLKGPMPRLLLTGSRSERPLLEEVARYINVPATVISDASVGQLAAILQQASLVMGVDSGALHLAASQNTPTLEIFGPTDPKIFRPWGEEQRHVVIASTQPCPGCPIIPCGRLDFTEAEMPLHPCVRLVPEDLLVRAALQLLIRTQSPSGSESVSRPDVVEK